MRREFDDELHRIFDAHDDALRALRAANKAMGEAIQAHDDAIQAAIEANQAAIKLLRRLDERE